MDPEYVKAVVAMYNQLVNEIARNAFPDTTRREITNALAELGTEATPEAILALLSPASHHALAHDALRRFVEDELASLEDRGIVRYRPKGR